MNIVAAPESDHEQDDVKNPRESNIDPIETKRKKWRTRLRKEMSENKEVPRLIKYSAPPTKTKIFRPNESILQNIPPINTKSTAETKNTILYKDDSTHRSAFVVPCKDQMNVINRFQQTLSSGQYESDIQQQFSKRKRCYPFLKERNAIAYCCCGSHNCKIKVMDYASDDSEADSYGSTSPLENKITHRLDELRHRVNNVNEPYDDFILRRNCEEYKEREDSQIIKLKRTLDMKFDPFMGYNGSFQAIDDYFSDINLFRS